MILRGELPPKVQIDDIPGNVELYWNSIWTKPEVSSATFFGSE
jgi:hypothetical protein